MKLGVKYLFMKGDPPDWNQLQEITGSDEAELKKARKRR